MIKKKEIPTIFDIVGSTVDQVLKIIGIDLDKEPTPKQTIQNTLTINDDKPKAEIKLKGKSVPYQVYLILPENNTTHTTIRRFIIENKIYFKLDYNNKIYAEAEIENLGKKKDWMSGDDGRLTKNACNFLFLSVDNKLSVGKARFTENAEKIVREREQDKLHDRAFENTHYKIHEKYTIIDNNSLMIPTIILVISIGLLLFFAIPRVIEVMNVTNAHGAADYAEKARIDTLQYTLVINETKNGTVITRT